VTAETPRIAAAILAGGQARRLGGADKASLEVGGAAIADRALAVLRKVAAEVFVVGGDSRRWPGLRVVGDVIPGAGALGGIYTAIVESPCERTLVVGCDMPFLSAPFLEMLAGVDADVVMPRSARGYEPLCAVYGKACAEDIRRRIERGDLHAAVPPRGVRVAEIGPEVVAAYDRDGLLLMNVNTPHDYARAKDSVDRITDG
jgi:molybdopterin-guanine dinucleotide biosynthesis protein A